MPPTDNETQDLLGHLLQQFYDSVADIGEPPSEAENAFLHKFITHARDQLTKMAPQSLVYTEAGIALHLADGTDLAFIPAIAAPNQNGGIDAMGANLSRGSKSSTIQMGDYPITGPKDLRHVRATQKRDA
jgi:hypothetical protein